MHRRRDVHSTNRRRMTTTRIVLAPISTEGTVAHLPPVSDFVASIILSQIMTSSEDDALQDAIHQSEQLAQRPPSVLTREQARKHIDPRRWSRGYSKPDDPEACPVCTDQFKYPKTVARLPCGHLFCSACIRKWVTCYSATCPVCRQAVGEAPAPADGDGASHSETGFSVEV